MKYGYVELVLNTKIGKLTAYILDAQVVHPITLKQPSIRVVVDDAYYKEGKKDHFDLDLLAAPHRKAGHATTFTVSTPQLKNLIMVKARMLYLTINDHEFEDLPFTIRFDDKGKILVPGQTAVKNWRNLSQRSNLSPAKCKQFLWWTWHGGFKDGLQFILDSTLDGPHKSLFIIGPGLGKKMHRIFHGHHGEMEITLDFTISSSFVAWLNNRVKQP